MVETARLLRQISWGRWLETPEQCGAASPPILRSPYGGNSHQFWPWCWHNQITVRHEPGDVAAVFIVGNFSHGRAVRTAFGAGLSDHASSALLNQSLGLAHQVQASIRSSVHEDVPLVWLPADDGNACLHKGPNPFSYLGL